MAQSQATALRVHRGYSDEGQRLWCQELLQRLPRPRHFEWRPESKIAERNIYRTEGLEPQEHRTGRLRMVSIRATWRDALWQ